MGALNRLKSIDFFKKLPSDLTEATLTGAGLSAIATIITVLLLLAELSAFLSVKTDTAMVVDRSPPGELLRINFNISFHAVSCEFLTLDVSDALGTKKMNLVKNVRKTALDEAGQRVGTAIRDEKMPQPKHDDIDPSVVGGTLPVSGEALRNTMNRFPLVVVNYYAPWCSWCKRLEPAWDALLIWAAEKYPINTDSRIAVVKVDCTQNVELCKKQQITGFPSIRIYRQGSDDVVVHGHHEHEAYHGDRSLDALKMFIDSIVPSAGNPQARSMHTKRITATAGCNVNGFVMSKKVPGTLHFHTKSEGYEFDHANTNMTHTIQSFSFGTRPTQRKVAALKKLHPGGLTPDWSDKLAGRTYVSVLERTTHEHYLQAVLTTVVPRDAPTGLIDAYEYTAQTHTYSSDSIPAAKVSYTLSPIQVMVRELPRPWYHFITTTCAIVGGVFTVLNLLDGFVYQTVNLVTKKIELGKQT